MTATLCRGCDSEVGTIDAVVTRQPLPAEDAGPFSDFLVDRMPMQGAQKGPSGLLLPRPHSYQHLQPGDLAGVQYTLSAFRFQKRHRFTMPAEIVDEHRRVNEGAQVASPSRRAPDRSCST